MEAASLAGMTADLALPPDRPTPVFLLGITHRSGTNYLARLLELHPQVASGPLPEDHLVAKLAALEIYLSRVLCEWSSGWEPEDRALELRHALGNGLAGFLTGHAPDGPSHILARTPSVEGIEQLRAYFPDARVVILIRDGRAVVESGMRSFRWNFDEAARRWSRAAERILRFQDTDNSRRHLIVRYEDLVSRPQATLQTLLEFLSLDRNAFPFDDIEATPVVGSSDVANGGKDSVHWRPTDPENFTPLQRFSTWSAAKHRRFDWLAGDALRALGYASPAQKHGLAESAWQTLRTALNACRPTAIRHSLRRVVRGRPPGRET